MTDEAVGRLVNRVLDVLNAQYKVTEDYCNAQTRLHNAWTDWTSVGGNKQAHDNHRAQASLTLALRGLQEAVGRVQDHNLDLQDMQSGTRQVDIPPRLVGLLQNHIDCTIRMLACLHDSLPVDSQTGVLLPQLSADAAFETRLVVLATLKASIHETERAYKVCLRELTD
jgi:hypothetical protein